VGFCMGFGVGHLRLGQRVGLRMGVDLGIGCRLSA
jgi:hypothetical protein